MIIIKNRTKDILVKNQEYDIKVNMIMVRNGVEHYGYDDEYYGYDSSKYGYYTGVKDYSKI